jgi:diguanylate cyclase (GGDEF)-like protein
VLVPRIVSRDALAIIAEKLRAEIKSKPVAGQIFQTVSIGGYFASPSENTDAILKAADDALYKAKQAGRDQSIVTAKEASKPG